EEDRLPELRALDRLAALAGALRRGRAAPVHRPGGRRRGARGRRCVLPRAPLRAAARLAVPPAGRDRCPHQPHRDRHRRHRHALREPALHGRGRGRRRPHLGRPAPARDQPRVTGAGDRRLALLRLPARRGGGPGRHGAPAHRRAPRGAEGRGLRRAQPPADVPQPAGAAAPRAALARPAGPHLVGRRVGRDGPVGGGEGHAPDELDPQGGRDRGAVPRAAAQADRGLPRRVARGGPPRGAARLGEPLDHADHHRPRPCLLRPRGSEHRPGRPDRGGPARGLRPDVRRGARRPGRAARRGRGDRCCGHAAAHGSEPAGGRLQRAPVGVGPHGRGAGSRLAL
ncbi:MAG: Alkanal monooxygenase alpha chain, partial [uncultured Friedmanniella sp.]